MKRSIHQDQLKSLRQLQKEAALVCSQPGCTNPLTAVDGPGSNSLCRDHQVLLTEYGGMGKVGKPHTLYRSQICEICGQDILQDPRLLAVEDLEDRCRIARILSHGDHLTPKADGGSDEEENIVACCVVCHAIKTVLNKDYLKSKPIT